MNVLKKIVSDNRSTEHFDKVIDILMSTGLSEIDAIKLFNMAVRESIPDDDEAQDKVDLFLGKDADRRKEWIENNIDFNTTDTFTKEVRKNEK